MWDVRYKSAEMSTRAETFDTNQEKWARELRHSKFSMCWMATTTIILCAGGLLLLERKKERKKGRNEERMKERKKKRKEEIHFVIQGHPGLRSGTEAGKSVPGRRAEARMHYNAWNIDRRLLQATWNPRSGTWFCLSFLLSLASPKQNCYRLLWAGMWNFNVD